MIKIDVYEKEDMPSNFLRQLFLLRQKMYEVGFRLPPPSVEFYRHNFENPKDHSLTRWIITHEEGKIVGYLQFSRNIKYDNLDRVSLDEVYVTKNTRRRGIGIELIKKFRDILPDQMKTISFWAIEGTAGQEFMERVLNEPVVMRVVQNVSDLKQFDSNEMSLKAKELEEKVTSLGFKIKMVRDAKFDSVVRLEKYVKLNSSIFKDVPMEDSSYEIVDMTVDRFMENYKRGRKLDFEYYTLIAIKDDKPVALTETYINPLQPQVGNQLMTGVDREYRGNKLGITLKTMMLAHLLEYTEIEYWMTDNAGSNKHMIGINKELGYKEWLRGLIYEREISN